MMGKIAGDTLDHQSTMMISQSIQVCQFNHQYKCFNVCLMENKRERKFSVG